MSDGKVRGNIKDHISTTKELVNFNITKEIWADVKGRFGKEGRSPQMPMKYHWPGTVGGLASIIETIPIAIVDKAEKWWQEQAKITRRWVR